MRPGLKDKDRRRFRPGLYAGRGYSMVPEYFLVSRKEGKWIASDGEREYELSYPKGMPHSSIMPEGTYSASDLERVPAFQIPARIGLLRDLEKKVNNGLALLLARSQPKCKGTKRRGR